MNWDRAAKIANSEGPFETPKKEKPQKESNVVGQVISLQLIRNDARPEDAAPIDQMA